MNNEQLPPAGGDERKYCVTIPGLDLAQAQALAVDYPGSSLKEE